MTRTHIALLVSAFLVLVPGVAVAGHAAFTDGPFGAHETGVHWMADTGITSGCTANRYCPNDPVTRAQMATFMHRLSGTANVPPSVDAATLQGRGPEDFESLAGPVSQWQVVYASRSVTGATTVDAAVFCPPGTRVLGGGAIVDNTYWPVASLPVFDGEDSGWYAAFVNDLYQEDEVTVEIQAICAAVEEAEGMQPQRTRGAPEDTLKRIRERVGLP